jgi:hypothetical protein
MDLSSRWDRSAALFSLLLAVATMAGCQALFGGGSSTNNGSVSAVSANLNFGTAVVGSSKQLTDTLTNHSSAMVTISSAASSDPAFQLTQPAIPFNLAPGQSASLTIAFTPQSAGKPAGKISIKSTVPSTGEIDVAVSGSAVAAGKLAVSPASLAFGSVRVGQSQAKAATLTNPGGTSVTISQDSVTSSAFTVSGLTLPVTLAAGQSATFNVTFAPKSPGVVSGSVNVNGNSSLTASAAQGSSESQSTAPTSTTLSVSGDAATAGQLAVAPTSVAFGDVTVGSPQSQTVTLTNAGGTSATISQATATGSGVSVSGLTLPFTLAPAQSSAFQVTFAPASAGAVTGSITIASTAANASLSLAVTGAGVAPGGLAVTPPSISFGSVQVGTSQNQQATITNTGGATVTMTKATTAGAGFSISGLGFPLSLAPGQSSAFTATFAPQASGSVNGSVAFASNVATLSVPLSGSGLPAGSLGASPSSVSFGNVQVGANQAQTITLTNSGNLSVTITQASASGIGFSLSGISLPLTLAANQSTTFTATFAPGSAGAVTGNVAITSTASNPSLTIALSGTGVTRGALAANPTSIAFGNVQVGSNQSQSESLSNSGGSALHISNATLTGAGFATSGLSVPATLNAGQSLTFTVTFTPQGSGATSGSLVLAADGSVPSLSVSLSGTGATPGQLTLTPATVNFGNVTVGVTQSQSGSLTASGASVTVSSVSSSNPEFALTGLSLPRTLSAGQSAPFTLTFTPQASGAASGTFTFASNATNPPVAESVTGTGTPAPQHSVALSWTASTSTVIGYNVYRGTQAGGPYVALNGAADASTSYSDSAVQAGQTYFYVVTAVDGSGNESVYSNQAQAVVPTP